ncbi:MAG: B12-binding domain-containing radical SAM protein [Candidatus Coatesbacteria bacterium]|nr:B12-binding domain-containing radical SAM protein [Candidatus Coatesbacteria bacterium]
MPETELPIDLAEWEIEPHPAERGLLLDGPAPRITLISPYGDITCFGIRLLASCLKQAGFNVRMIFLPVSSLECRGDIPSNIYKYPRAVLEQIAELCVGSLFVGVSFMTNYYDRVTQLCKFLKHNLDIPVVLGGIHPTLEPEECAAFADYLCVGEGEEAIVELAVKLARDNGAGEIRNIWPTEDGAPVFGPLRPLIRNLDSLPFPDYDLSDDHVLFDDDIIRMTPDLLQFFLQEGPVKTVTGGSYYITLTSRGCKFNCTYCCNTALSKMYPGEPWLRYRSPQNIVDEIAGIAERMPFVGSVFFCDDSFLDRGVSELDRFRELYRKHAGLPFFCLGTPLGITREKMEILTDAGLRYIQMGIQTGSPRTARLYKRRIENDKLLQVTDILHDFADKTLPPRYDVIVDNPFETSEDVAKTVRLLSKIKRPYFIQYFCLTLLPATELLRLAKEEGIIEDVIAEVYRKQLFNKRKTYLNSLLYLLNTPFPPFLIRWLSTKPFRLFFDRRWFERMMGLIVRLETRLLGAPSKGIKGILRRK